MYKQNKNQQSASNPEHNVWVMANAGSGKTKVLTDRVLRLMLEGTAPEKILCLTFTKNAATEMLGRINKELSQWVIVDRDALSKEIENLTGKKADNKTISLAKSLFAKVVDNSSRLKIQNFHSFCQSILKRFPLEADIAPHFKVADDQTEKELIKEAWHRLISGPNDELTEAISNITILSGDKKIEDIVSSIINQRGQFQKILQDNKDINKKIDAVLGVESKESIIESFLSDNSIQKNKLIDLCEYLSGSDKSTDVKSYNEIQKWLAYTKEERWDELDDYKNIFLLKDEDKAKQTTSVATKKSVLEKFPEARNIIEKEQAHLLKCSDKIKSISIANLTKNLFVIADSILCIYKDLKEEKSLLDRSDLILATKNLFSKDGISPWVLYKIDDGIEHILVDEAQDTSPEQWEVVRKICEEFFAGESKAEIERTLFVVGDEKQSIFSFQGADLNTFNDMYKYFGGLIKSSQRNWESIPLETSYRSANAILKAVDNVFLKDEYRESISSIALKISHIANKEDKYGKVELWPLLEPEKSNDDRVWPLPIYSKELHDPKSLLADKIAKTISEWVKEKRILLSQNRPIEYGDIMILVRKREDGFADTLINSLHSQGVDVAGIDRMVLTEHIAVMDLIALTNFLLLPEDDLSLASILKSPLINLSEDELFDLAYNRGKASLWNRIKEKQNDSVSYKSAYNYLSEFLNSADFVSPFELYSKLLDSIGGRKKFISKYGKEVNDPLDEFLNFAYNYSFNHTPSLQGFLNWINSGDIKIKRDFVNEGNEVKIMTVHGAKGLEAPIVFLPDTGDVSSRGDLFLFDKKENLKFWAGNKDEMNSYCRKLYEENKKSSYSEYLRLLYVAMTRAEEELYICGWKSPNRTGEDSWYNIIKEGISEISEERDDNLVIESGKASVEKPKKGSEDKSKVTSLPKYFKEEVASPEEEISKTGSDDYYTRGTAIHILLEKLPEHPKETRLEIAKEIASRMDIEGKKDEIIKEALSVIDNFPFIFEKNSKAEVPLISEKEGERRIDRLIIDDNEIHIIDYKTDREVPKIESNIPSSYLQQMSSYKNMLKEIYPDKDIKCSLLWTSEPKLMQLNDLDNLDLIESKT